MQFDGIIGGGGPAFGITLLNNTLDLGRTVQADFRKNYHIMDYNTDATHPVDIRYNWFKGSPGELISCGNFNGGSVIFKYNFIDDMFIGTGQSHNIIGCVAGASNGAGGNLIRIQINGTLIGFDKPARI